MSTETLAAGWQAIYDDNHKRYYYYDTQTGNSQWEMPVDDVVASAPPPPPASVQPPQSNVFGFANNAGPAAKGVTSTTTATTTVDESPGLAGELDSSLAATEDMLSRLNVANSSSSSSGGKFDFNNPGYEFRDSDEDEEEEPYVLEDTPDTGYDSDGNPRNFDNMEVHYGDVYGGDEDDGWIDAVNPDVKPPSEWSKKQPPTQFSNPATNSTSTVSSATSSAGAGAGAGAGAAGAAKKPSEGSGRGSEKEKDKKPRIVYPHAQLPTTHNYPSVQTAYEKGSNHEYVQCIITRDRGGLSSMMYPTYELRLETPNQPLLLAKKMNMNRTSNYHMFDLTRGQAASRSMFSKSSGNFIGKLRARDIHRTEYVLLNASASEREEVAGFMFDRMDVMTNIIEGSQPRKLLVVVPPLDAHGIPIPNRVAAGEEDVGSIINVLRYPARTSGLYLMHTKEPTFINGNYRLNFKGRVKIPSVKNFQIVSPDDLTNVLVQFGKVGDDKFHLDFKAPFNAMQAFALALSQFNL
jgi:hypothetical protein